eukprot:1138208-Pelagomonas_calceolata.AAC.6
MLQAFAHKEACRCNGRAPPLLATNSTHPTTTVGTEMLHVVLTTSQKAHSCLFHVHFPQERQHLLDSKEGTVIELMHPSNMVPRDMAEQRIMRKDMCIPKDNKLHHHFYLWAASAAPIQNTTRSIHRCLEYQMAFKLSCCPIVTHYAPGSYPAAHKGIVLRAIPRFQTLAATAMQWSLDAQKKKGLSLECMSAAANS